MHAAIIAALVVLFLLARRAQGAAVDSSLSLAADAGNTNAADQGNQGETGGILYQIGTAISIIWAPPGSADPYLESINAAELRYGLPSGLLARLLYQESRYRPEIIDGSKRSSAGAVGIAQFMPATARDLGIDPTNPYQSIDAAGKYLRRLYDSTGSWSDALAAYNWGIGNVQRKGLAAAPTETQNYVSQITSDLGIS